MGSSKNSSWLRYQSILPRIFSEEIYFSQELLLELRWRDQDLCHNFCTRRARILHYDSIHCFTSRSIRGRRVGTTPVSPSVVTGAIQQTQSKSLLKRTSTGYKSHSANMISEATLPRESTIRSYNDSTSIQLLLFLILFPTAIIITLVGGLFIELLTLGWFQGTSCGS